MKTRHTVLSIAGSDCSGGAGIQADLKTFLANGVYGMSVITALTAQNTMGVTGILETPAEFLEKQLEAVFSDIMPEALKIGMISSAKQVEVITAELRKYAAKNVVYDPVMISTSGKKLMEDDTIEQLKKLLPLVTLLTPNLPEAETLCQCQIQTEQDTINAAKQLEKTYGCAVLIKGGHRQEGADDLLCIQGACQWLRGKRIETPNTHGTGCTLSSAIAANLAKGQALPQAVANAKTYLSSAIGAMLDLGSGSGPMDHGYFID